MGMRNYVDKAGEPVRVGKVRVKIKDDGKLYVAYWSGTAGKMISDRVEGGDTYNAALKHASKVNSQLTKKAPSAIEAHSQVTIREALDTGIQNSKSKSEHHRANLKQWAGYFCDWLSKAHPEISRWDQIRYTHLDEYVQAIKARGGVSPRSAEHYCSVISITARYYATRINPRLYIVIPNVHPYFESDDKEREITYLTARQAVQLLAFAQARTAKTDTGVLAVALGCFCGLNLREIVRLNVGDVEKWDDGMVTVEIKRSKNQNRPRMIPVPEIAKPILLASIEGRFPTDLLIKTGAGRVQGAKPTDKTIYNNLHDHLLPAAAKNMKCSAYEQVVPSDVVRTTTVNLMIAAGVLQKMRAAYVGHGEYKVLEKFYEDKRLVTRELQREVVDKVDAYLEKLSG